MAAALGLWDALVAAGEPLGLLACGLGARDTPAHRDGLPAAGQDISLDVTPTRPGSAGPWGWGKDAFWGKEVLTAERAAGPRRRLQGLVATGRGIPAPPQ